MELSVEHKTQDRLNHAVSCEFLALVEREVSYTSQTSLWIPSHSDPEFK